MTQTLADKAQITFGEKRYMQGLLDGLLEYGERKREFADTEEMLKNLTIDIRTMLVELKDNVKTTANLLDDIKALLPTQQAHQHHNNNIKTAAATEQEEKELREFTEACNKMVQELETQPRTRKEEQDEIDRRMAMYKAVLECKADGTMLVGPFPSTGSSSSTED